MVLGVFVPESAEGGCADDKDADVRVEVGVWVGQDDECEGEGALAGFAWGDAVDYGGL